jgi:hypothetical protein
MNRNPFPRPIDPPLASISDCIFGCDFSRRKRGHFSVNLYGNYSCIFANLSCWPLKSGQTEPAQGLFGRYSPRGVPPTEGVGIHRNRGMGASAPSSEDPIKMLASPSPKIPGGAPPGSEGEAGGCSYVVITFLKVSSIKQDEPSQATCLLRCHPRWHEYQNFGLVFCWIYVNGVFLPLHIVDTCPHIFRFFLVIHKIFQPTFQTQIYHCEKFGI